MGIQDAARKRRAPSQRAGAWAGSIVRTNNSEVGVLVSDERWTKTRLIIRKWILKLRENASESLNTKELFSDRGFLVYVTRTYGDLTPYLKGIHLKIDGWRKDRDSQGWKHQSLEHNLHQSCTEYPEFVTPVPRLITDLKALSMLTSEKMLPLN